MKAKNILMSVLLAMGFIAAKADGNPPELILVSQPVLKYNYNSVTVTYDLQNIGDYSYKGDICIYLDPDDGTEYAYKRIKVCPGKIKRVSLDISAMRLNPSTVYTIMPYYEMEDDLYSFTTFEYFEPISFSWDGPRTATWIVTVLPPRPRFYTWPGDYRFYYDGFMPPPPGPGPDPHPLPPPDPHHHTYHYHHDNGGYPGGHNPPPGPNNGGGPSGGPGPNGDGGHHDGGHHDGGNNGGAHVRPDSDGGSMSHGNANGNNPAPNGNGSGSLSNGNEHKPNNSGNNAGSNSGRTGNNSNVSRPSGEGSSHTGTTPTNERRGSGNVSRPSGNRGAGAGGVRGGAGGRAGRGGGGRGRR